MQPHFNLTDSELENQFANLRLNPELFTHEAHLRLAWIHITQYGIDVAIQNITRQLKAFTISVGAGAKYNHTLTIAAVKAVSHFMGRSSANNFKDFIAEFPQLNTSFKQLIDTHYKTDIFNCSIARTIFVEPDLVPFT